MSPLSHIFGARRCAAFLFISDQQGPQPTRSEEGRYHRKANPSQRVCVLQAVPRCLPAKSPEEKQNQVLQTKVMIVVNQRSGLSAYSPSTSEHRVRVKTARKDRSTGLIPNTTLWNFNHLNHHYAKQCFDQTRKTDELLKSRS